jgi:hypothetical protein
MVSQLPSDVVEVLTIEFRKLRQAAFRASVLFTAFLRLVAIFVDFIFEVRCGQTETLGPPRP